MAVVEARLHLSPCGDVPNKAHLQGGDNETSVVSDKKPPNNIFNILVHFTQEFKCDWLLRYLDVKTPLRDPDVMVGCDVPETGFWFDRVHRVCEGKQDITLAPAARRITILELRSFYVLNAAGSR